MLCELFAKGVEGFGLRWAERAEDAFGQGLGLGGDGGERSPELVNDGS
jgi:hypothetical protein